MFLRNVGYFQRTSRPYLPDHTTPHNHPCETQNYWVFGFILSSGILEDNTMFRKLDLFPSPGEGGEDIYSVWPLRKC
jgi:hypothetical protein